MKQIFDIDNCDMSHIFRAKKHLIDWLSLRISGCCSILLLCAGLPEPQIWLFFGIWFLPLSSLMAFLFVSENTVKNCNDYKLDYMPSTKKGINRIKSYNSIQQVPHEHFLQQIFLLNTNKRLLPHPKKLDNFSNSLVFKTPKSSKGINFGIRKRKLHKYYI